MKQCSARAKAALGLLLLLPLLFIGTASVQAATPDATDAEPAADQATTAEPTAEPSADKVEPLIKAFTDMNAQLAQALR